MTSTSFALLVSLCLCVWQPGASSFLSFRGPNVTRTNVSSAPTHLPPSANAGRLRDIQHAVKSLEVPKQESRVTRHGNSEQTAVPTSPCSLLGGLVVAEISHQCCTNAQVVTQRQLGQYDMAQRCKPSWQCEADGKTPSARFETQSLSSLCGEPGCLPAVVSAFKSNPLTTGGAAEMGGICLTLSSLGGSSANPQQVSHILSGGRVGKGSRNQPPGENGKDEESACFPGEALATVQGKGNVPVAMLQVSDQVQVQAHGRLSYEPILAFLHVIERNSAKPLQFVQITHAHGSFRASPSHIVFVRAESGASWWSSKLVGKLHVGETIFAADVPGAAWDSKPSRVLAIQHGVTKSGMYAPLTMSGTIVVDGVIASNYASSSEQKPLSHSLAHAFFFPVRLYHSLGLASMLQPIWSSFCSSHGAAKNWLCQGGDPMMAGPEVKAESEELHPYLRLMWRSLNIDQLLPSQVTV